MKYILLSVLMFLSLNISADSYVPKEGGTSFKVLQTTPMHPLREVLTTPFSRHRYPSLTPVDLDGAEVSHEYLGIGASLTDASCWLLSRMPEDRRKAFIGDAFGKDGMNLSIARLNCGSSDYATELYNYNDTPDDVAMKHFSVGRDELYLIPVLKEILDVRPDLFLFSSIWSCPGWMKSSGEMCGGSLLEKYEKAFANYWTAYLTEYKKRGININAITVQNEPRTDQGGGCPATLISGEQEARIAGKYLPVAFRRASLDTKIWVYDHNYNPKHLPHLTPLLSDPDVQKNAEAIAWHPYTGNASFLDTVHRQYPSFKMHLTERGPNLTMKDVQTRHWWCRLIFDALNHGCQSYTAWNLLLNEDGQPNTGRFACGGLEEVNSVTSEITRSSQYDVFHQFGPYVDRGAEILKIDQPDKDLSVIAFRNPDGSYVVVVSNEGGPERKRLEIKYKNEYLTLCLPVGMWSMTTVLIGVDGESRK